VTKSEDRAQSALDKSIREGQRPEKKSTTRGTPTYNVAIARADGYRKVAIATCESQSGVLKRRAGPGGSRLQDGARRCQGKRRVAVQTEIECRPYGRRLL